LAAGRGRFRAFDIWRITSVLNEPDRAGDGTSSGAQRSPAVPSRYGFNRSGLDSGTACYNVCCKALSDQNYTQIDSGDGTTAYTDNNVTAGQTYDYVVTAVNAEDEESGYSNMVQVTIPTP
jgi:hypothetical protein